MEIIEFISQPWHWFVSGLGIVIVMFLLLWQGGEFGVSSNLRTMCAISGAGKRVDFFKFNWSSQVWNMVFIFSAIIGGYIASSYLSSPEPVQVAESTQQYLSTMGIEVPQRLEEGTGYVPKELFDTATMWSGRNLLILVGGGFLIGFGTRYAGGCTSGHAISGLSNFQLPSLIAVIGFFIGGLLMSWVFLPQLLQL